MPHIPDTHIIITPKFAYINDKIISAAKDILDLSAPSPAGAQTTTLTITPTTLTILNDDDPDTINKAYEAATRATRDEASSNYATYIFDNDLTGMPDA